MEIKNIVIGKTLSEYYEAFGHAYLNGDLWDFPLGDLECGAIELRDDVDYWIIDGRAYEAYKE